MKKCFFILMLAVVPAFISAQVVLTADSNYIKIERSGGITPVLYCKDLKFAYDGTSFYFSDKLGTAAWEYTVKYTDITRYNTYNKGATGFPSYVTLRDALITFIKKGKSMSSAASADSLLRYNRSIMGLNGAITITGTDSTATPRGWCVKALTATVINKIWYKTETGRTSLSTYSLAADACFYGDILSVDLTSGSVIVYKY